MNPTTPTQAEELAKQLRSLFDDSVASGLTEKFTTIIAAAMAKEHEKATQEERDRWQNLSANFKRALTERESLRAANAALAAEVERLKADNKLIASHVEDADNHLTRLRADKEAADQLIAKSLGALVAAKSYVLADRREEDGRRSESGAPEVEWPKDTPYDEIIELLRAHLTPSADQNTETKA